MWVTPDQLGQIVEKLVDQKLKERQSVTPEKSDRCNVVQTTPVRSGMPVNNQVKSPSDTTLCRPALMKRQVIPVQAGNESNLMISKIADFVDAMRVQQDNVTGAGSDGINRDNSTGDSNRETGEEDRQLNRSLRDEDQDVIEAQARADRLILEAEKYKAALNAPAGDEISNALSNLRNGPVMMEGSGTVDSMGEAGTSGLSDNDFFHLTCHIDPVMRGKIEKGEYVDLGKAFA